MAICVKKDEKNWRTVEMKADARPLISLMANYDLSTAEHLQDVGALLFKMTSPLALRRGEKQMIALAGYLHDIGKLFIPRLILEKPGRLTEREWEIMRMHTQMGAEIVSYWPGLRPLAPIILAHHERWDGQGYPQGLAGREIPLGARLIAVVDAYLVMRKDRPYQKARSRSAALGELQRCSGTQFDPRLVELLMGLLVADQASPSLGEVV